MTTTSLLVNKLELTTREDATDPDAEAVDQVLQGDTAAYGLLVRRHQRGIYYLCLRYLRLEEEAADMSQRVFLRAYERLGTFRARSTFRTWLYRIAVNLCLNALRDAGRRAHVSLDEARVPVEAAQHEAAEQAAACARLRSAVDRLPPKQRMTVILRVYQELSFSEVAEIMGNSEGSAKVNFHHAMRRLKGWLATDPADGEDMP